MTAPRIALISLLILAQATASNPQPQATTRIIATIPFKVSDAVATLEGRRLYIIIRPDTLAFHDIAEGKTTRIGVRRMTNFDVSRRGDLLAYQQTEEGGSRTFIWSLPLDPRTGMPSGPQRRVSLSSVMAAPKISPDGRFIAFGAEADSSGRDLTVIPSSGGTERRLYSGELGNLDTDGLSWSPDGLWVYFGALPRRSTVVAGVVGAVGNDEAGLALRVRASGGTAERLSSKNIYTYPGLSPNGQALVFEVDDSAGTGVHNPAGQLLAMITDEVDGWLKDSELFGWETYRMRALAAYDVVAGRSRVIIPESYNVADPAWSDDGRRIAAFSWDWGGDTLKLLLANADGTGIRTHRLPNTVGRGIVWSPDGQRVALYGGGGMVLTVDITTGKIDSIRPSTTGTVSAIRWSRDSQRVLFARTETPRGPQTPYVVREARPGGPDRIVRTIRNGPRNAQVLSFVSDSTVLMRRDPTTWVYSLTTGDSVRVFGRTSLAGVSPNGSLFAFRSPPAQLSAVPLHIDIVAADGRHVKQIVFPTAIGTEVNERVLVSPDGKLVFSAGRRGDEECCSLYQGSIVDGSVRQIVELPPTVNTGAWSAQGSNGRPQIALSPDGRTLLYTLGGADRTVLTGWDLSAILRARRQN